MSEYENNYVSCVIQGGLGNQLFQIAVTLDYADKYNKTPIFKNVDFLYNPCNHERRTYWSTLFDDKLTVIDKDKFDLIKFTYLREFKDNIYKELEYIEGNVMIIGYFQSYKYISEKTRIKIIELIYSKDDYMYETYKIYNEIIDYFKISNDDDMVSMHVRRGDYLLNNTHHYTLDVDYYEKAYNISCDLSKKKRNVVVFSDDIKWCKENFSNKFENIYFVDINNTCIEFILLSFFQNNIIENSTFSLFASYISSFKDKIIISPKKWFGKCGPQNIDDTLFPNIITI